MNPAAKIIATADEIDEVPRLYEAGADYVIIARLNVAGELLDAIRASEAGLSRISAPTQCPAGAARGSVAVDE